ncbi:TPA: hypothetical protein ACPVW4_004594 [Vibrio parahaemolyticus]
MDYREAIDLLGLSESELDEYSINRAFKARANEFHPDKETGNTELMAKLSEAREYLSRNMPSQHALVMSQQVGLAIAKSNEAIVRQKRVEKQATNLRKEAINDATHRLHYLKNVALVFMAISAFALFLGKDLPKELVSIFHYSVPDEVIEKPKQTTLITQYLRDEQERDWVLYGVKNSDDSKTENTKEKEYTESEQREIDNYLYQLKRYESYFSYKNEIVDANKKVTLIWYVLIFTVAGYCSLMSWNLNFKIKNVENMISDLYSDLQIRSDFYRILMLVFEGEIPIQWTFNEMLVSIDKVDFSEPNLRSLKYYLGVKKLCQALIVKGQEFDFLVVNEEGFEELYSLPRSKT